MKDLAKEPRLSKTQKRIAGVCTMAALLLFVGLIIWLVGRPMIRFVSEPEKFREWVSAHGIFGKIAFVGMMIFQVVIAVVPGEPLEIGAGYAFGAFWGTVLCVIGNIIGGVLVFILVRTLGIRLVEVFFPREKILSLKFLQNTKRFNTLTYIVFLLPGTPKDLLSYFVGLTNMKMSTWIIITGAARLPSVITSTVGGSALGTQDYLFAGIVFGATLLLSGIGLLIYRKLSRYHEKKQQAGKN